MEKKPFVTVSDITKFGDRIAKSVRSFFRSVTKKLSNNRLVRLTKATSRENKTSISIEIGGDTFRDPSNPEESIDAMILAIEHGARPHRIYPRHAKRLAFFWPKATPPFKRGQKMAGKLPDGRLSFFYVDHPGMKGRSPMAKAIGAAKGDAIEELTVNIRGNIIDNLNSTIREINSKK